MAQTAIADATMASLLCRMPNWRRSSIAQFRRHVSMAHAFSLIIMYTSMICKQSTATVPLIRSCLDTVKLGKTRCVIDKASIVKHSAL